MFHQLLFIFLFVLVSSFYLQSLVSSLITKELSILHKNLYSTPTPLCSASVKILHVSRVKRDDHFVPLLLDKKIASSRTTLPGPEPLWLKEQHSIPLQFHWSHSYIKRKIQAFWLSFTLYHLESYPIYLICYRIYHGMSTNQTPDQGRNKNMT